MKERKNLIATAVAALVLAAPAWASPRTVTLNVSGMTCPACPVTVKKRLRKFRASRRLKFGMKRSRCWSHSTMQRRTRTP